MFQGLKIRFLQNLAHFELGVTFFSENFFKKFFDFSQKTRKNKGKIDGIFDFKNRNFAILRFLKISFSQNTRENETRSKIEKFLKIHFGNMKNFFENFRFFRNFSKF